MADAGQVPGPALRALYAAWAAGGAGLIMTGNVMIDGRAHDRPRRHRAGARHAARALRRMGARRRARSGAQVWMQINHPGRQVFAAMKGEAWAPSAVALDIGKHSNAVRAAARDDRGRDRRGHRALRRHRPGRRGGRLHRRADPRRARLPDLAVPVAADQPPHRRLGRLARQPRAPAAGGGARRCAPRCRRASACPIKLNSADFQRGGFSEDDARQVLLWLNELPVDLVELSGGSYEAPAMQGRSADGRTLAREAYFLEFAKDLAAVAAMPVMTTGGIRRRAVAEQVLASGVAMVGVATALAARPGPAGGLVRRPRGRRAGAAVALEGQGHGGPGRHGAGQAPPARRRRGAGRAAHATRRCSR